MTARLRDDVDLDRVQADVLGVGGPNVPSSNSRHVAPGDPMRVRQAAALVCLTLAIGGAVGAVVIRVVSGAPFLPAAFGFGPAAMVGFIVMGLSWASIGAFLVMRRPENAVGLLLVICGAGYALTMFFAALAFAFAAARHRPSTAWPSSPVGPTLPGQPSWAHSGSSSSSSSRRAGRSHRVGRGSRGSRG